MGKPVKVCWIVKGLGPGGAERLLVAAAAAHDRDAFELEIVYLLPWKDHLVGELQALGVRCTCLDVRDERDVRWARRLRRLLREREFDIVHTHSPYAAAITRLVVRSLPRPRPRLVNTEHNPWSTFKPLTRYANAITAPLDDARFAVSDEARDSMSRRARQRTEVLVHGIDLAAIAQLRDERTNVRHELRIDEPTPLVGIVANYHPKKDWPNVLRAARLLADRGIGFRMCAVGQGPLEDDVETLRHELGLEEIVHLTGYRADATRVMAAFDVFVLGSRWEGLPVALMEASALGLPIVSTAVGGIPEAFTDGVDALLVPPGSPAALADGIERVLKDPALGRALSEGARQHARDFDAARAVGRIEAVYRQVMR